MTETKWKCLVNPFGYCIGEPDFDKEPIIGTVRDNRTGEMVEAYRKSGTCKLLPNSCNRFSAASEVNKGNLIPSGTLKDTRTLKDKPKEKAKAKKKVQDGLQGSMFQ